MNTYKVCFLGCALPLLFFLFFGIFAYSSAKGFTIEDARVTLATVQRKVERALESSGRPKNDEPVPILMYHFVRDNVNPEEDEMGYRLSMPEEEFKSQMQYLKEQGYTTIHLEDLVKRRYPENSVVLTFDDGYRDFRDIVYPILAEHNFTATVFIITNRLDNPAHLSETDLKFLINKGVEVGFHSSNHQNLSRLDFDQLRAELSNGRTTLEEITGGEVITISYPAGEYNNQVIEVTKRTGYEVGVTTQNAIYNPKTHSLLTIPRVRVTRGLNSTAFASLLK